MVDRVARKAGITPEQATLAIETMREPTEVMALAAVQDHLPQKPGDPPLWLSVWQAMIDAALRNA